MQLSSGVKIIAAKLLVVVFFALFFYQLFYVGNGVTLERWWEAEGNTLEVLLGAFTALLSLYVGVVLIWRKPRSATAQLFLFLSIIIAVYAIVNYLSLHPPTHSAEEQLFWIRTVMFLASFFGPTLFLLVVNFPHDDLVLSWRVILPLVILTFATAIVSYTPWLFSGLTYPAGQAVPIVAPGLVLFLLNFGGLVIASIAVLYYKYRFSRGEERASVALFFWGMLITFVVVIAACVVAVFIFKTSSVVFLGPPAAIVYSTFIASAIIRHNLLKVRLHIGEFLLGIVTVFMLTESALAGSFGAMVFKIFFATVVGLLGLFLIHSMQREFDQRTELVRLATLEEANQKLQMLDQQKSEFLTLAAHHLRTPLSVVSGYIDLLRQDAYGKIPTEAKGVLEHMNENNMHLVSLVDEFLDISRIEQHSLAFTFNETDINELVSGVVHDVIVKATGKKIDIPITRATGDAKAVVDVPKIRQVIYNLVDNAVRYGDGTARVEIALEKKGIAVRVMDKGMGFTEQESEGFFQKFYRGKSALGVNVNTGTGLGLYICRMFVEGHSGHVWARSAGVGKGSEFGFWIPKQHV